MDQPVILADRSRYDEPKKNPMTFPAAVPEIPAADVGKAAAYYVDTLGFTLDGGTNKAASRASQGGECRRTLLP